jgi:PIN domain nuclease of toxin-antitoxin system
LKVLLDTRVLLWWLADDKQLGIQARDLIADPANDILVSVASLWEIAVKIRVGKLQADVAEVADAIERDGFTLLPICVASLKELMGLPMHHRDPFDDLLIALAISEQAILLSEDEDISRYPVQVLRC